MLLQSHIILAIAGRRSISKARSKRAIRAQTSKASMSLKRSCATFNPHPYLRRRSCRTLVDARSSSIIAGNGRCPDYPHRHRF